MRCTHATSHEAVHHKRERERQAVVLKTPWETQFYPDGNEKEKEKERLKKSTQRPREKESCTAVYTTPKQKGKKRKENSLKRHGESTRKKTVYIQIRI